MDACISSIARILSCSNVIEKMRVTFVVMNTTQVVVKIKLPFFFKALFSLLLNPFTPTSDQERISPYNINTISSRQVMRIEKNINHGIIS